MSRERCLARLVEVLGATRLGRELGLARLRDLEDFRAALPILDRHDHERDVEHQLGFGVLEADDPRIAELAHGAIERTTVVQQWIARLGGPPRRVAMLRASSGDAALDRIARDDLAAFAAAATRADTLVIDRSDHREDLLASLEAFSPDVLVVPSAMTCEWLAAVHRTSLERRLPSLRLVLAEHDVNRGMRGPVPMHVAGWIGRSGRLGLPSPGMPRSAVTLAIASQIIELLPYTNPEEDGRRVYAERTILPEHAVLGMRYELVVSSALGFLRMRTDAHVRVVGFDPPDAYGRPPRPRVIRLAPAPMDVRLEGCTVAGAWLTASIRQALGREDPALVDAEIGADPHSRPLGAAMAQTGSMRLPEAFRDTELAWLAGTGTYRVARDLPRALLVRMELQGHVGRDLPPRLAQRIDDNLQRRSPAYAYLRRSGDLGAPRVAVVPAGTRRAEQERRIVALLGPVWVPEVRVVEG